MTKPQPTRKEQIERGAQFMCSSPSGRLWFEKGAQWADWTMLDEVEKWLYSQEKLGNIEVKNITIQQLATYLKALRL